MIDNHPTARTTRLPRNPNNFRHRDANLVDQSADLPHQQNEQARPCREWGCNTLTYRCHAVCASHVRPSDGFGCCARCKPAFFGSVVA